jgi:hypothetical protein
MARPLNCTKCGKPKRPRGKHFRDLPGYCICGRKTVMTKDVLQKLEDAFMNSFSDQQACAYAGIGEATLYNYQKENPEFVERKQQLKMRPDLKAKQTIVGSLGDPNHAWRWLERKDPEFKPTTKIEHAGEIGVNSKDSAPISDEEKAALEALHIARRKRIEKESNKNNQNENEKQRGSGSESGQEGAADIPNSLPSVQG